MIPLNWPNCVVDVTRLADKTWLIKAHSVAVEAVCPACRQISTRLHSHYTRSPADAPCFGMAVRVDLTVQRFRCENAMCSKITFAERFVEMLLPYARRATRLTDMLREIAFCVGGEAGKRLGQILGMYTSASTLIRIIRATVLPDHANVTHVGIDDWAKRRGHTYGTILVNLETHQVIDLLPDREPETVATWLREHPEIELVTRDRGTNYIIGVTAGAPQAEQVADRWHLLKNMSEAVQRQLFSHTSDLRHAAEIRAGLPASKPPDVDETQNIVPPSTSNRRQLIVDEVKRQADEGISQRQIAHNLKMSRNTVARYVALDGPLPPKKMAYRQISSVARYADELKRRWEDDACHNIKQLWRELRTRGFNGSYVSVWRFMQSFQRPEHTPTVNPITIRTAVVLLTQPEANLDHEQQQILQALLSVNPVFKRIHGLVQRFGQLIRGTASEDNYDRWRTDVTASDIKYLKTFAVELHKDDEAVRAAMTSPWSNGQTEGQVNRLKTLKRQMYGRANFDLLRLRVLYRSSFT